MDKNFVQRIARPDISPVMDLDATKGEGSSGTHFMSSATVGGKPIVYPEIIEKDGKLQRLKGKEAVDYALETGEFISFNTLEEAEWFGKNYKKLWGESFVRDPSYYGTGVATAPAGEGYLTQKGSPSAEQIEAAKKKLENAE